MKTALIAVGGNSLIRNGEIGTIAEQWRNARRTAAAIVQMLKQGWEIVLTHGNGPQVGAALLRSEKAADQVYSETLDVCDAATQGEIGYVLEQSLRNELVSAGLAASVATIITQCVVDAEDPAFLHPTKPIGPAYSKEEAEQRMREFGWHMVRQPGKGFRRTVASPDPLDIVELPTIRQLVDSGTLVIAAGGGGIPVVRTPDGGLQGVEAVIDKDRASALLASKLRVDLFIIATDTDSVYMDFATPSQRRLGWVSANDMQEHLKQGQFPAGSMGPKVESALRFLASGGKHVIITCYEQLIQAVEGSAGTHIMRSVPASAACKGKHPLAVAE